MKFEFSTTEHLLQSQGGESEFIFVLNQSSVERRGNVFRKTLRSSSSSQLPFQKLFHLFILFSIIHIFSTPTTIASNLNKPRSHKTCSKNPQINSSLQCSLLFSFTISLTHFQTHLSTNPLSLLLQSLYTQQSH
jgi:hypothetical protein